MSPSRSYSAALVTWIVNQTDDDLFIESITLPETQKGIVEKPAGRKRTPLENCFAGEDAPQRHLPLVSAFDKTAAFTSAQLMVTEKQADAPQRPSPRQTDALALMII